MDAVKWRGIPLYGFSFYSGTNMKLRTL